MTTLDMSGLRVPAPELPPRIVAHIYGWEKTGKTHFALSGRKPAVLFNLDGGDEGVAEQFDGVFVYDIPRVRAASSFGAPEGANQNAWMAQWQDMYAKLCAAYAARVGTVVIDTMTELYALGRLAHFGKLDQVMPQQYAKVYRDMEHIVQLAREQRDTTTVFISRMREDYETKAERWDGWKNTAYEAQVNVLTDRSPSGFRARIESCRQNAAVMGMAIEDASQLTLTYLEWLVREWRP